MDSLFQGALFAYEDVKEPDLRGLMAYSAAGKLYVVDDEGSIRSADVRQQLLSGAWAQDAPDSAAEAAPPPAVRVIEPSPALELTAAHFALNRSGTFAAVAGSALEDPETSRVAVVDLSNCRPATHGGGGGARRDVCDAVPLDPELFAARPGLRVLQVGWHPASDTHLAVLTSDNTWRLYNTQRADLAEQTFELQLRGRRGLGLGAGGRAAVAFAFGPPDGWQRFSLLFLASDGSLWSLCPVVPFGCRFPAVVVDALREEAGGGGPAAGPNAEAWLQRSFTDLAVPQDHAFAQGMVQSVPSALDEHVPALAGPLAVVSAAGEPDGGDGGGGSPLLRLAGGGDVAVALLLSRFSEGCTAAAVATARGWVGLHLLMGGGPAWCESAPQCVAQGAELLAVRSQPATAPPGVAQPELLLVDAVNLSLPQGEPSAATADDDDGGGGGGGDVTTAAPLALVPDAAALELIYAVHSSGAHALTLPWLPLLAGALGGGGGGGGGKLPAALPPPGAELLLRSRGGVVAAAAVGGALAGSALVVLEADGRPSCLRPTCAAAAAAAEPEARGGGASAAAAAAAQRQVEAQVATVYGDLFKGVAPCQLPRAAGGRPAGAGTPEGQRLLVEAAAALRAAHVEFAHQAAQDLAERAKQLQEEVAAQQRRLDSAAGAAAAAAAAADALDARASRLLRLQGNLGERLRLLAELHWALPRPPSRAELAFAARQLPAAEAAAAALRDDAAALRARAAALRRRLRSLGEAAAGAAALSAAAPAVPPHQLRRVREALALQEAQIAGNQQRLAVLEEAVAMAAAVRG